MANKIFYAAFFTFLKLFTLLSFGESGTPALNMYWTSNSSYVTLYNVSMTFPSAIEYCFTGSGTLASVTTSDATLLANSLTANALSSAWLGYIAFGNNSANQGLLTFTGNAGIAWINSAATGFATTYTSTANGIVISRAVRYYFNNGFCLAIDLLNWVVLSPTSNSTTPSCATQLNFICKYSQPNTTCNSSWTQRVGDDKITKCYLYISTKATWSAAVGMCFRQITTAASTYSSHLLYFDAEDPSELTFLMNFGLNTTVWLGAIDVNPIAENYVSSYTIDSYNTPGYISALSSAINCPVLQSNATLNSLPIVSAPYINSSFDCTYYTTSAAICKIPGFASSPNVFDTYSSLGQFVRNNLTATITGATSNTWRTASDWKSGYLTITGNAANNLILSNFQTINLALDNTADNVTINCAKTVTFNSDTGNSVLVMNAVDSPNVSLTAGVTNSDISLSGFASGCVYTTNAIATAATVVSTNLVTDRCTLSNYINCRTTAKSSNTAIYTHNNCNFSAITISTATSTSINLNNVASATQQLGDGGSLNGMTTLNNVYSNTATYSNGLLLLVAINLNVSSYFDCLSNNGYVIMGLNVIQSYVVANSLSLYVSSRVANTSSSGLFVTNVPTVNSSVLSVGTDMENVANATLANINVVATQQTEINLASVLTALVSLWNVGSTTQNYIYVNNTILSLANVNNSIVQCPIYALCTTTIASNNSLTVAASNIFSNYINCSNIGYLSYTQDGGNYNYLNISMQATSANVLVNNVQNNTIALYNSLNSATINCNVTNITNNVISFPALTDSDKINILANQATINSINQPGKSSSTIVKVFDGVNNSANITATIVFAQVNNFVTSVFNVSSTQNTTISSSNGGTNYVYINTKNDNHNLATIAIFLSNVTTNYLFTNGHTSGSFYNVTRNLIKMYDDTFVIYNEYVGGDYFELIPASAAVDGTVRASTTNVAKNNITFVCNNNCNLNLTLQVNNSNLFTMHMIKTQSPSFVYALANNVLTTDFYSDSDYSTFNLVNVSTGSVICVDSKQCNIIHTNSSSTVELRGTIVNALISYLSSSGNLNFSAASSSASITVDVYSLSCPAVTGYSAATLYFNLWSVNCDLPTSQTEIVSVHDLVVSNISANNIQSLSINYSNVTNANLSITTGLLATVINNANNYAVGNVCNFYVSINQYNQSFFNTSNLAYFSASILLGNYTSFSIQNVSQANLIIFGVQRAEIFLTNVGNLTVTLVNANRTFNLANVAAESFTISDVILSPYNNLALLPDLTNVVDINSTVTINRYTYIFFPAQKTSWSRAVEQCGAVGGVLASVMNDQEILLYGNRSKGENWLGGMTFKSTISSSMMQTNTISWVYRTDRSLVNNVIVRFWPRIKTNCVAYNSATYTIEEPLSNGTEPSCFRKLPYICKLAINPMNQTCPLHWVIRNSTNNQSFCYNYYSTPAIWTTALSRCSSQSLLWPASVATQVRLLDFDAWDLNEAKFINSYTTKLNVAQKQVWVSGFNNNGAYENISPYVFWIDESTTFISYSSFQPGFQFCPVYLVNEASFGLYGGNSDADCIDYANNYKAICKVLNPTNDTYQVLSFDTQMSLQQATVRCGAINATIASIADQNDTVAVTNLLAGKSSAWLGLMTFAKCETTGFSDLKWGDYDSSLLDFSTLSGNKPDINFPTNFNPLCPAYSFASTAFKSPTVTPTSNNLPSCFQTLPFLCKQKVADSTCLNSNWTNLQFESSSYCYYFVSTPMNWGIASSFCASLSYGFDSAFEISETFSIPRLYFMTRDVAISAEASQLLSAFPVLSEILVWTMALNSGPVCENSVTKDLWINGLPFKYLGNNVSSWSTRSTICPLLSYSTANNNWDWSVSATPPTSYSSAGCSTAQSSSVVCEVPPMATTTTRDPRITTTPFPLPTPYILSDVRYQNTADHYWCFLGSCVLAASNQSYIAYATYDSPSGNIVSPTASAVAAGLIVVYDNGTKTSPELIALTDAKLKPQYSQFPILQDNMANVVVEADLIASSTASFKAVNRSCIIAATYSQANVADNQRCIFKPQLCYYGLSAAVWVKFPFSSLYGSTTPMVMIGTDTTGFSFYQKGTATGVTVTTNTDEYKYEVIDSQVAPDVWLNIGFRWSSSSGILIYVNNIEHFSSVVSQRRTLATSPTTASYLSIGCTITSATQRTGFATMSLAHVAIWMWNLRTPERVFLSGGLNYVLSMTTATTNAVVSTASNGMYTFDYGSNMAPYQPTWTSSNLNPMFSVANFYDELTSSSTLSAGSSSLVSVGPATNVPQIKVTTLTSAASFIKFSFTGRTSCMNPTGGATFCPKGIGVGMILNITSTAFNALMNSDPFVPNIIMLYHQKFAVYLQASLLVIEFYDQSAAIQFSTQWLDSFVSFGFTWSPVNNSLPLTVYVNGQQQPSVGGYRTINVTYYLATAGVYAAGDLVIGSSFGTVPNLQARDLVIWDRYLFPVDAGRFLGLTQDQFQMFLTNEVEDSNYWWTTDIYAYNTMQLLSAASGLYVLRGATYNTVPDRWNKSVGIVLPGSTTVYNYPWLLTAQGYPPVTSTIGLFPQSNCFLNPGYYTCVRGLSVAAWIMITDPESSSIQIFYSTGDSVALMYTTAANDPQNIGLDGSTGCTILQDGMYIGVSCSTSSQMYDMYMDQTLFQVGTWINLGFTFSIQNGLRLFINGRYTGLSQPTGISVPRPPAAKLSHGRCVIGHYSSDYTDFWTSEGSFTYANGNFSDLFILTEEKSTDEFGAMIGLDNNYYYSTATMYYPLNILVTGSLQLLQSVRQNLDATLPYGPYGTVGISTGVDLGGSTSGLLIGALSVTDCLHNVSVCAESGMSLSTWISISSSCQAVGGNQTVYILRTSVYPQNNEGVFIYAEFNKLYVTVQYNRTGYSVPVPINSLNLDRYFNLAFIWEKTTTSYLLTVYVNGSAVPSNMTTYIYVQSVPRSYEPLVFGALPSASSPSNFSVFNFAFWNTSLSSTQLNQLSGFTTSRLQYLSNSDIYWVFSSTYKSIQVIQPQLENNADLSMDRFGTDLVAELDSTQQSYVILGNKAQLAAMQSCVVMPSNCVGLFLQFWAYLYPAQNGYILSSGAENTSIQGIVISQYSVNVAVNRTNGSSTVNSLSYLGVLIRTNTKAYYYSFDISASINSWASYAVFWNRSETTPLALYVNNYLFTAVYSNFTDSSANLTSGLYLGRAATGPTNFISGLFDDILVKNIFPTSSFSLDAMINQVTCYTGAVAIYALKNGGSPRQSSGNITQASSHLNHTQQAVYLIGTDTIFVLDTAISCASNPAACSLGLTASVWANIRSLPQISTPGKIMSVIIASGVPSNMTGFAIYLLSALTQTTVTLRFELNDGKNYWLIDCPMDASALVGNWINYAISWSPSVGLFGFINGIGVMQQLQKVSPPPAGNVNQTSRDLMLGKFTSYDMTTYLDIVFDTTAFWATAFTVSGGTTPRTLSGDCTTATYAVTAIPSAPAVTTFQPNPNCAVQVVGVCTDQTIANVLSMGTKNFTAAIQVPAAQLLLPNLLTLTSNVIVTKTAGDGMTTTISPSGQAIPAPYSASFLTSSASILQNVASSVQTSALAGISKSDIGALARNFTGVADNILDPSTASVWASVGANASSSILKAMEQFLVVLGPSIVDPTTNTSTIVGNNIITNVAIVNSKNCSNGLQYPLASDPAVQRALNTWGSVDSISIPQNACMAISNSSVVVVSNIYNSISSVLPSAVVATGNGSTLTAPNSRVISITTSPPLSFNGSVVKMVMQLLQPNTYMNNSLACAYWNFTSTSTGGWSTNGCNLVQGNSTYVTCECNHMTNFVVLMQPVRAPLPDAWKLALLIIYIIGLSVSVICLVWFLFVLIKFKANLLKDDRCLITINLIGAFLTSDILLLISQVVQGSACKLLSILIQFFITAAFEWLYFEALHYHYAVSAGQLHGRFWKCYVPLGWLLPAVITAICVALFPSAYGAGWRCWLSYGSTALYVFIGTCAFFSLMAIVTNLVVLCNISHSKCNQDITAEFHRSAKLNTAGTTLIVAGWLFGSFAVGPAAIPFELLYTLIFSFNGLIVFVFFGVTSHQLLPLFLCRSAENRVVDSVAASLAGSIIDVRSINDKTVLVSDSRPGSSRRSRPGSSSSVRIVAGGDPRVAEEMGIVQVPRISYRPDSEIVERLKKKQQEIAAATNQLQDQAVPSDLFEVGNTQRKPTRKLLPLTTKQGTSKSLPFSMPKSSSGAADTASASTSSDVASPPSFIKPKKQKQRKNRNSNQTSKSPRPSSPSDD